MTGSDNGGLFSRLRLTRPDLSIAVTATCRCAWEALWKPTNARMISLTVIKNRNDGLH